MRAAVLCLVLLLAGGCGVPLGADQGGVGPDAPTSAPGDPNGDMPVIPEPRSVREGAVDVRPRPFEEAVLDRRDGQLHVVWWTGVEPCNVLAELEVEERADRVIVTVHEGQLLDADGEPPVCIEIAERASAPVPLDAPLGDRALVDGATGEEVPVSEISAGA